MDFNFTEEQTSLRDTLRRFIRKDYAFEKRRTITQSPAGFSTEVWKQFADLGLLAMTLPEEHGGLGGGAFDTLVIMEELGRGLVVEPYLSTVVLGAGLLARGGSPAQQEQILAAVAGGEAILALAHFEPGGRYEATRVGLKARQQGDGWRLTGAKSVVLDGDKADYLIVSARTSGSEREEKGISLFLVDAKAAGIERHSYPTQDDRRAAEIRFTDVQVGADALIGTQDQGFELLERSLDEGLAAMCAEAVGCMDALVEATLAYLKTRKQFGLPIGSFQALQHRMADMLIELEQARSMAYLAAARLDTPDRAERRRIVSAAKALVGKSARFVGEQAVQLHGGIGTTEELAAGHYFKRLTTFNATFGDADHHLGLFSDLMAR